MYTPGGCGTDLAPASPASGVSGLGCPGCGGKCQDGMSGLTFDGSGLFGTGIFGTGVTITNLATWSWAEYATLALVAYVGLSLVHTTKTGYRATSKRVKKKYEEGASWGTVALVGAGAVGAYVLWQAISSSGTTL